MITIYNFFIKKHTSITLFTIFIILLLLVFRSLISNMNTNLLDWFDYPYYAWVVNGNINKILTFDFSNLFNTNAFYPNMNSLFFSDLLIPQSILGIPARFFTNNPIIVFNTVFLTTFVLNYVCSYIFWEKVFDKVWVAFIGTLLIVFSPFFHSQMFHFQMISFWPFFLTLYYLVCSKNSKSFKYFLLAGFFLAVQFLASVYLGIFLIFSILIFYAVEIIFQRKNLLGTFKGFLIIFGVFILLDGIFIKGYFNTKKMYKTQRDYGEYVQYSAHLSDYLFTQDYKSALGSDPILDRWNSFNKHSVGERALFPGFLITIFGILGIFSLRKLKNDISLNTSFNRERLLFIILLVTGLIFSLGPRLNFNGAYAYIPLPYHFLVKYLPLIDSIRAVGRWSFLFYLGLTYFALTSIKSFSGKKILPFFIIVIFFIEYFPTSLSSQGNTYLSADDTVLKNLCSIKKTVVLEFPVTHFSTKGNIADGLSYITKRQLASLTNKCFLINGYSGYDLPSLITMDGNLSTAIKGNDIKTMDSLLKQSGANILHINWQNVPDIETFPLSNVVSRLVKEGSASKIGEGIFIINK